MNYILTKRQKEVIKKSKEMMVLIKKTYGKRCKDFAIGCPVCHIWQCFDSGMYKEIKEDIKSTRKWT